MIPLLLITPGRSGGSIVTKTLASHSQVFVCGAWPFEQRPAAYLMQAYLGLSIGTPGEDAPENYAINRLYKNGRSPFSLNQGEGPVESIYKACVVDPLTAGLVDMVRDFYHQAATELGQPDSRYFIEKVGIGEADTFRGLFETVKPVFLIRDPRDAVVSMSRWTHKVKQQYDQGTPRSIIDLATGDFGRSYQKIFAEIKRYQRAGIEHHVLRYEALMQNLPEALAAVLRYLELDCSQLNTLQAVFSHRESHHVTSSNAQASLGQWDCGLATQDRDFLLEHFAELAGQMGYDCPLAEVS